jgi:hypothetical protein
MDYDALVRAYRAIRDKKSELNKAHDAVIADLDGKLEKIENVMLGVLNASNGEGIRTEHGTFFRKVDIKPSGQDWAAFYDWIKANDAFDFLQRRITATAVTNYMLEHDGELPPGVTVLKRFKVEVRKNND